MKKFMLKVFGFMVEYLLLLPLAVVIHWPISLLAAIGKSNLTKEMLYYAYVLRVCTPIYRFECWRRDLYDARGIWYEAMDCVCDKVEEAIDEAKWDLQYDLRIFSREPLV